MVRLQSAFRKGRWRIVLIAVSAGVVLLVSGVVMATGARPAVHCPADTAASLSALDGLPCTRSAGGSLATGYAGEGTTPSVSPSSTASASPAPAGNAMAAVAAMQPGWNLGNSLDAVGSDETAWGNPRITKTLLDNVRAQGFNSIRIPVTWSAHQGGAPSYTVDSAYMSRVKQVVDWALADGFYVMINVHHDSWQWIWKVPSDHTNVLNRYNALWTQIAAAFRAESPKLTFESVNEPQFTGASGAAQEAALLNELNTSFYRIVRKSGGNNASRLLVLPTLHTSADQARIDELVSTFKQLNDHNLIATVHYYGYWPFSVNISGVTRFDSQSEQDIKDTFDRVYKAFVTKGIPVIIGEFGLLGFDTGMDVVETGEALKYFESLGYYARTKKLTTMFWDNGGQLNRATYQWNYPQLIAMSGSVAEAGPIVPPELTSDVFYRLDTAVCQDRACRRSATR